MAAVEQNDEWVGENHSSSSMTFADTVRQRRDRATFLFSVTSWEWLVREAKLRALFPSGSRYVVLSESWVALWWARERERERERRRGRGNETKRKNGMLGLSTYAIQPTTYLPFLSPRPSSSLTHPSFLWQTWLYLILFHSFSLSLHVYHVHHTPSSPFLMHSSYLHPFAFSCLCFFPFISISFSIHAHSLFPSRLSVKAARHSLVFSLVFSSLLFLYIRVYLLLSSLLPLLLSNTRFVHLIFTHFTGLPNGIGELEAT